jgi:molecular chaperone HtpG
LRGRTSAPARLIIDEAKVNSDAQVPADEQTKTQNFEADVARLLQLMVHSVYSDRDIFVRELVSNAADACEKLRYEAIAKPELIETGGPFRIEIAIDSDAKTIAFADNGVGMTRAELVDALGTIARSGTRAFLDRLAAEDASKEASNLIGQFGIGFYSSFMVADQVVVETRRAGTDEAWRWSSDGKGAFAVAPLPLAEAPARGARVILHLNEASHDYLDPFRLERIVREHSGAVAVPIDLVDKPGAAPRRVADGAATWAKPKSEVKPEEYAEFYRSLSGQFDEPALTVHWRAEGRHEYAALAFVPGSRPFDLFDPARKSRNKLYVRRVLITQDADLLPGWLRFVRLVVDSADLPLNVSREMIQQSAVFVAIRKGAGALREDLGAFRRGAQGGPLRGPGAPRRAVQARALRHHHPSRRRPHPRRLRRVAAREPDRDLLPDRRGRQAACGEPAARRLPRARRRGAAACRSGRRLLGVERGRLRGQAVQVGQPGRRRHQGDRAEGGRGDAGRGVA